MQPAPLLSLGDAAFPPRGRPLWWLLLRHEARLFLRDGLHGAHRSRKSKLVAAQGGALARLGARPILTRVAARRNRLRWAGVVLMQLLLHAAGLLMLFLPRTWQDSTASRLAAIAVLAFLFTFMLSSTMSRVVTAFHERRDLDLLLGAPIPPTLILAIRVTTIALATFATFAYFVFPIVDTGVVVGRWWLARIWLLLPLLALLTTGIALSLTDLFVRLVGVRRARVGLQVFSALIGASVYLVTQARQFLPHETAARLTVWFQRIARVDDAPWPVEAVARLARGDLGAWAVLAVVSVAVFAAAVHQAQRRFIDVAQTPEADGRVKTVPRPAIDGRLVRGFGHGLFATLMIKEWRLLLRAPQLISQVLLQTLYLLPLIFVGFSHRDAMQAWSAPAFASGVVAVAGTLATSLAWLTISGEDAPDLIAGSPRPRSLIVGAKIAAATLPPVGVVLVAAIAMGRTSLVDAGLVLMFGILSCVSAAVLSAASPAPGKRSDFQRRHKGRAGSGLLVLLQFIAWAGAAGAAVGGHTLISVALTVLALCGPALTMRRALDLFRDAD